MVLKPFNTLDNVIGARIGGSMDAVLGLEFENVLWGSYNVKTVNRLPSMAGKAK